MTHLALYANGGPEIGYGHLVRTSALATAWLSRGGAVEYVTTTPETTREIAPDAATVTAIEVVTHLPESTEGSDVLVTDSYAVDHALQQELRGAVSVYGAIIDRNRHPVCCDVLINGNLYAPELDYEWTGAEPTWCLGPAYVLLRERIQALAAEEPPWRESPERALVTMGGGDSANLTPTVVRVFDGFDLRVDAIVGPGFSTQQERAIHEAAEDVTADVTVVRDPEDLPERMFQADVVVCTASSTVYELLALGTPMVAVPVAENQQLIADALREQNLAAVTAHEPERIRRAIERYLTTLELRRNRRERSRRLVDGRGTDRVVDELDG